MIMPTGRKHKLSEDAPSEAKANDERKPSSSEYHYSARTKQEVPNKEQHQQEQQEQQQQQHHQEQERQHSENAFLAFSPPHSSALRPLDRMLGHRSDHRESAAGDNLSSGGGISSKTPSRDRDMLSSNANAVTATPGSAASRRGGRLGSASGEGWTSSRESDAWHSGTRDYGITLSPSRQSTDYNSHELHLSSRGPIGHQQMHHGHSALAAGHGNSGHLRGGPPPLGSIAAELDLAAKDEDLEDDDCLGLDFGREPAEAPTSPRAEPTGNNEFGEVTNIAVGQQRHALEHHQQGHLRSTPRSSPRSSPRSAPPQHHQRPHSYYPSPPNQQQHPYHQTPESSGRGQPQPPDQQAHGQGSYNSNVYHHPQGPPPSGLHHPPSRQYGGPPTQSYYHGNNPNSPPRSSPGYGDRYSGSRYSGGGQYGQQGPGSDPWRQQHDYHQAPDSSKPSAQPRSNESSGKGSTGQDRLRNDDDNPSSHAAAAAAASSHLQSSSPPKKRRLIQALDRPFMASWEEGPTRTPAKDATGISPFRSPVPAQDRMRYPGSSGKLNKSPLFPAGTETPRGPYSFGEFGIDTPGGNATRLDDIFQKSFDDDPTPFPVSHIMDAGQTGSNDSETGIRFDPKLVLSQSASGEEGMLGGSVMALPNGGNSKVKHLRDEDSTFTLMGELSPWMNQNVRQGPPPRHRNSGEADRHYQHQHNLQHRSSRESRDYGSFGGPSSPRHRDQVSIPPLTSKRGGDRNDGMPSTGMLKPSPMSTSATSGYAKHRRNYDEQTYSGASPAHGAFRLQIGDVGMNQTEARKEMDGINNVLKGSAPRRSQSGPSPRSAYSHDNRGHPPTPTGMRSEIGTPIKVGTPGGPRTPSGRMGGYYGPSHHGMPLSSSNPHYPPYMGVSSTPIKLSPAGGKENESPKPQRRNPCNCKKSKCLKLYCECFAAELYCDGCNCNDCSNTPTYEAIRSKAIKDTKAKNPNAFKPRIAVKPNVTVPLASPSEVHNMGCRCRKSACLKKYCECFEAGVMCGNKCKCIECLNFVGSQALIDRRRKIKDHRGAEMAMRTADEAWKGGRLDPKAGIRHHPTSYPSPGSSHRMGHPSLGMPPSHGGPQRYLPPPMMMGQHSMGYSPMGMPPAHHSYPTRDVHRRQGNAPPRSMRKPPTLRPRTPVASAPRTPAIRLGFDPHSTKKRMGDRQEPTNPYFGPNHPEQTKTTALAVFSFLSNDDIYNASLVSKVWSKLSTDGELWQF